MMDAAAIALRAAPLTQARSGGRVVGWVRRGERLAVLRRSGNRVKCQLGGGRIGWCSIAVERSGTPLLRLREGTGGAAQLAVRGQRSQEMLGGFADTITLRRVAVAPYQPPPSFTDEPSVDDVLSIVKVAAVDTGSAPPPRAQPALARLPAQRQQRRQQQPLAPSRPGSATLGTLAVLRAGRLMAEGGNLSAVRTIVAQLGEDVVLTPDTSDGRTMLHHAAGSGQLEVVQYLLECGAAPNAADIHGSTPLMHTAGCAGPLVHLCAATLLSGGADHAHVDARQHDAVHYAASHGNTAVLRILLGAGATVGGRGVPLGRTALHLATENDHPACVQLLVDGRADVNARTADGMTALHSAAWRGSFEALKLLLWADADTAVRTQEGHTALDLAAGFGRQDCAQLVQYHDMLGLHGDDGNGDSEYDLEMFSTPQQLVDEGLVAPLSDRVIAGLDAIASCLDDESDGSTELEACAAGNSRHDGSGSSQLSSSSSGRLRPLSAKSKAVADLLTLEDYEKSKLDEQQQIGDSDATRNQENEEVALSGGNSYMEARGSSASGVARRQRSAPALTSAGQMRAAARSRPQTASAAVQQRTRQTRTRPARKKTPASAGPTDRGSAAPHGGPEMLSMQGTVRAATSSWGMREWQAASCQFKLAPTPVGAEASVVNSVVDTDEVQAAMRRVQSGRAGTARSASAASERPSSRAASSAGKRGGVRPRPQSAAAITVHPSHSDQAPPALGQLSALGPRRPGSAAIPTTAQWQPPGVEEAAAHYLTAAQKLKRQEERLALKLGDDGSPPKAGRSTIELKLDLSLYHAETAEEREEREVAEAVAAVQIQAIARGRLARQQQATAQ
jgi:hypothetical protein